MILNAAGIAASSGLFFHTPTEVITGKKSKKDHWKQPTTTSNQSTGTGQTGNVNEEQEAALDMMFGDVEQDPENFFNQQ